MFLVYWSKFLGDSSDSCAQQQDCFLSQVYRVSNEILIIALTLITLLI